MAKIRPSIPNFSYTTTPAYRQRLEETVTQHLPAGATLVARNFARSTASSYWLLKLNAKAPFTWITVRIATHQVWLQHAQQLEILWEDTHNFDQLGQLLVRQLTPETIDQASFTLTAADLATIQLLKTLERDQLIWFIRMPPEISDAHKAQRFDLQTDFMATQLMLGDRNNANHLLVPVKPRFQHRLADFFGKNLLFSQFTKHHLLKLLPTNQWLQPIMAAQQPSPNWRQEIVDAYGHEFAEMCFAEIRSRVRKERRIEKKKTD